LGLKLNEELFSGLAVWAGQTFIHLLRRTKPASPTKPKSNNQNAAGTGTIAVKPANCTLVTPFIKSNPRYVPQKTHLKQGSGYCHARKTNHITRNTANDKTQ